MMFYIFKDASGDWRWHLKAANEKVIADSGEGYRNRTACLRGIELVKGSSEVFILDMESREIVSLPE